VQVLIVCYPYETPLPLSTDPKDLVERGVASKRPISDERIMMRKGKDCLIFPLDLPALEEALKYVSLLKNEVGLFKVGLELFISEGPAILDKIRDKGGEKIFLDLKLHDIPATVKRAFMAACRHTPEFVTVHCDQGEGILRTVAHNNPGSTRILAITVLTSLNRNHLHQLGYEQRYLDNLSDLVLLKARMAKDAGCHGVVCSGQEVAMVKQALGPGFVAVTPGIRPAWSLVDEDDQKRIVTPEKAIGDGADYIVVGRPIRDAKDPAEAAARVSEEIEAAL
jgi:orotidine-5'-phosphate decarboxylase